MEISLRMAQSLNKAGNYISDKQQDPPIRDRLPATADGGMLTP
jgi:hypothetical protein